jgi:hypothetical protein
MNDVVLDFLFLVFEIFPPAGRAGLKFGACDLEFTLSTPNFRHSKL